MFQPSLVYFLYCWNFQGSCEVQTSFLLPVKLGCIQTLQISHYVAEFTCILINNLRNRNNSETSNVKCQRNTSPFIHRGTNKFSSPSSRYLVLIRNIPHRRRLLKHSLIYMDKVQLIPTTTLITPWYIFGKQRAKAGNIQFHSAQATQRAPRPSNQQRTPQPDSHTRFCARGEYVQTRRSNSDAIGTRRYQPTTVRVCNAKSIISSRSPTTHAAVQRYPSPKIQARGSGRRAAEIYSNPTTRVVESLYIFCLPHFRIKIDLLW